MKNKTMIRRKFFDSLKRGTGESYLIFKNNPDIDFSDLIIKGAVKNYSYDNQCEGSRADYIFKFIKKNKKKNLIVSEILSQLEGKKDDFYGLDQMCDLAVLFYKSGYKKSKVALYNRFEKNSLNEYEFCGKEQIIKIDGFKGILKVAEVVGKILYDDPEDWEDGWYINDFQKENKSIDVYVLLKKEAKRSKYIAVYYKSIIENTTKLPRVKRIKRLSYEYVKNKIDTGRMYVMSESRANELTAEEVEKLAKDFITEKNKKKQCLYLRYFSARKFPFSYKHIFKIITNENPKKNRRLVGSAVDALMYFKVSVIRAYALERIRTIKHPYLYLDLLVGNYKKNDYRILIEVANRSNNYDYIHSIVFSFINIYEKNPTKDCREPLEIIYKKMNCSLHRKDIVEILRKNKVLSDTVLNELQYDSCDEIRKFGRKYKKNR